MSSDINKLSSIGDSGLPVDWFFIYKVAGKSEASDHSSPKGTEYIYFDSSFGNGKRLVLSPNTIDNAKKGAISNTLNQLYESSDKDLGWLFYNDEDPITGKTNPGRGHTKGVLAFNTKTNSAFWLVHSTPKFAPQGTYEYPTTAVGNGQTFLCITLKDADEAKKVAHQMYHGQEPNVYLASDIPPTLKGVDTDPRVWLMDDHVKYGDKPYAELVKFYSRAGKTFLAIAKNKHWDTPGDDDFYNDLVSIKLKENIEVETWEHGKTPPSTDKDSAHKVMAAKSVDLAPLHIQPSYYWSEENDHAKLALSDQSEKVKYVCVGDLNFTIAQEKRSGGTVAFKNDDLWKSLWEIIEPVPFNKKKYE